MSATRLLGRRLRAGEFLLGPDAVATFMGTRNNPAEPGFTVMVNITRYAPRGIRVAKTSVDVLVADRRICTVRNGDDVHLIGTVVPRMPSGRWVLPVLAPVLTYLLPDLFPADRTEMLAAA